MALVQSTPRTGESVDSPSYELLAVRTKALAGSALVAALITGMLVGAADPPERFPAWGLVLAVWLAACAAYALAWMAPRSWGADLRRLWRLHRLEVAAALVILLVALVLRTIALDRLPRTLGGDDALAALNARQVLEGRAAPPFTSMPISRGQYPTLYFYGQATLMRLVGDDAAGARAFSALIGAATAGALYLLARQWFGPAVAAASALFLTAFPYHLFWSRNPLNNVADSLAVVGVLLFTTRALDAGRPRDFALAGLALGLSQYGYQSARLLFAIVLVLLLREAIADRTWLRRSVGHLTILVGGVLVTFLPQAVYFARHPDRFFGRFSQVSIFQSGWLAQEVERTGQTTSELLFDQLLRTIQGFYAIPPRTFFEPGRPLLDPPAALFALVGLVAATCAVRRRGPFALLITTAAFLLAAALTENTPNSARLVATAPLAALLVGLGVARVLTVVAAGRRRLALGGTVAVALCLAAAGAHFYFAEYASGSNYDSPGAETVTEVAYDLRSLPPEARLFFIARPRLGCSSHATLEFIAPGRTCLDAPERGQSQPWPALHPGDLVAAVPERRAEAERLAVSVGATRRIVVRARGRSEVLYVAFEVPGARGSGQTDR